MPVTNDVVRKSVISVPGPIEPGGHDDKRDTMGHYPAATGPATGGTARDHRLPLRPRLHRRLVIGAERHRRVHSAGAGITMGVPDQAGNGDRGHLYPRACDARDDRGHACRPRTGPVRAGTWNLDAGGGPAMERDPVRGAVPQIA